MSHTNFGDYALGAGMGGVSGATTGAMVGGPWGALIGGVAGIGLGALGVGLDAEDEHKKQKALDEAAEERRRAERRFNQKVGQAGAAVPAATQAAGLGAAGNVSVAAGTAAMTGPGTVMGSAGAGTVASANVIKSFTSAVAGGMTSGDALGYMTKMNMLGTGVKMVAGFFDKSEEEQRAHERELLSMKYAFGKPMTDEQKAFKAANPDWIGQHAAMQSQDLYSSPNLMQSQAMANLPTQETVPSPYVQQQTIGQPTFGRQGAGAYGTTAPKAFAGTTPGLIKKGTQGFVDPRKQGYV